MFILVSQLAIFDQGYKNELGIQFGKTHAVLICFFQIGDVDEMRMALTTMMMVI